MSHIIRDEPCPYCTIPGRPWSRGMCTRCYRRWHRAGFPADGPPAPRQPPPLDEVAVLRAMAGERLVLTPEERREAARRLDRRGHPRGEIAERLDCCVRTVERAIYPRTRPEMPTSPGTTMDGTASARAEEHAGGALGVGKSDLAR